MKVSIIIPIYNVEKYIERCAVSLFEQDFEDIEYIFVNDCTPDNSVKILEKIIEKYPNRKPYVKIIHHKENKGLGATRKTGLKQATGEYILHIDSDDWCELDMVSSLYNKAKVTDTDIVACDYFINYKDKQIYKKQNYTENVEQDTLNVWSGYLRPFLWNKLVRRTLYSNNNLYPPVEINMTEDYWLAVRLFTMSQKVAHIPNALYHYWQENENALTKNFNDKSFEDFRWLIKTTTQFLIEKDLCKKYIEAFYTKILAYLIWLNGGKYDRKFINSICPKSNKLKYIDRQPTWYIDKKNSYIAEYLNQMPPLHLFLFKVRRKLKKIKNKILENKGLGKLFQNLILLLSYLIPRSKNIWLFGTYNGLLFNDNAKYLFLYINENYPEINPIWISKNKETIDFLRSKSLKAYHQSSFKGIYYALRGKFYCFNGSLNDINLFTSGSAVKLNLWHGIPIKKIAFDCDIKVRKNTIFDSSSQKHFLYPNLYNYVLSTSKAVSECFSSAFRVDKKQCLELGYPRNEILSYSKDKIMEFVDKYEPTQTKRLIYKVKKYQKVFIYMPTWRENGQDLIKDAEIDFEVLNKILVEQNSCFMLKLHHLTRIPVELNEYQNIILVDNTLDIYPLLQFTDCLITDYSSIYFDYHLLNKTIILFCFDKDRYINVDRGVYYDYSLVEENQLIANNFTQLVEIIKTKRSNSQSNQLLKDMILETQGIGSSKEIVDFFKNKY